MAKKLAKPLMPPVPLPRVHRCTKCGMEIMEGQELGRYFYPSASSIYNGNDNVLHLCKNCCADLYQEYYKIYNNPVLTIRRVCQLLDVYYISSVVDKVMESTTPGSQNFFTDYMKKMTAAQKQKTYKDTEADDAKKIIKEEDIQKKEIKEIEKTLLQKSMDFFGPGFTDKEYNFLQEQYDDWITRHECQTKTQEELFKSLSLAQLRIRKLSTQNDQKGLDGAMKSFQDLLNTANLQPKQMKNSSSMVEANTLGTLIEKWENDNPIPQPDPEFADVDNIRKYITVWFYGHMCKMLGIKNDAAEEYEREKAKYSVSKPHFMDDDETNDTITDILKAAMHESDGDR